MKLSILIIVLLFAFCVGIVSAQKCGVRAEGALCPGYLCCGWEGYCGTTYSYCDDGACESQCWDEERDDHRCGQSVGNPPCGKDRCCGINGYCGSGFSYCHHGECQYRCWTETDSADGLSRALSGKNGNAVSNTLSESLFDEMFKHRKDCPSQGFYGYDAFISAAASFPSFGTTGDLATRKRELAAFLALTSQATTAGRSISDSVDAYAWGYCHINTTIATTNNYCTSSKWPCASGKKYNSRGPIQLTHNYNYGRAGEALGLDLITNPDLVATDPVVSFQTAIWFWMTKHDNKTSFHNVVIEANSKPNQALNYGSKNIIGNLINGAYGRLSDLTSTTVTTSIGYYKRYCDMLDVSYGDNFKLWNDITRSLETTHIRMPVV